MSVLIALKDKDRVVVGVDTRMSCGPAFVDSYKSRPKAYHVDSKRNVIIGAVGASGLVDVFKILVERHLPKIDSIDRSYVVKYMIPELINDIKVYSMEDKEYKMDGELFLAIKDRGYSISGNYAVEELESFTAMGSGMDVAKGSLYTSDIIRMLPEERIALAIKATGLSISSVSPEAIIGDTAGKVFSPYNPKRR